MVHFFMGQILFVFSSHLSTHHKLTGHVHTQGHGIIYGLAGELYTGNCDHGMRHGLGKQTYRDWDVKDGVKYHTYYGNWVDGKREGKGQVTMCKLRS